MVMSAGGSRNVVHDERPSFLAGNQRVEYDDGHSVRLGGQNLALAPRATRGEVRSDSKEGASRSSFDQRRCPILVRLKVVRVEELVEPRVRDHLAHELYERCGLLHLDQGEAFGMANENGDAVRITGAHLGDTLR